MRYRVAWLGLVALLLCSRHAAADNEPDAVGPIRVGTSPIGDVAQQLGGGFETGNGVFRLYTDAAHSVTLRVEVKGADIAGVVVSPFHPSLFGISDGLRLGLSKVPLANLATGRCIHLGCPRSQVLKAYGPPQQITVLESEAAFRENEALSYRCRVAVDSPAYNRVTFSLHAGLVQEITVRRIEQAPDSPTGRIMVGGRAFRGDSLRRNDNWYLPLGTYVEYIGGPFVPPYIKCHAVSGGGDRVCLRLLAKGEANTDDHANCPLSQASPSGDAVLYVNGTWVPGALIKVDGRLWIDPARVTPLVGGYYVEDSRFHTVDMGFTEVDVVQQQH